jgi:hypothetical protein
MNTTRQYYGLSLKPQMRSSNSASVKNAKNACAAHKKLSPLESGPLLLLGGPLVTEIAGGAAFRKRGTNDTARLDQTAGSVVLVRMLAPIGKNIEVSVEDEKMDRRIEGARPHHVAGLEMETARLTMTNIDTRHEILAISHAMKTTEEGIDDDQGPARQDGVKIEAPSRNLDVTTLPMAKKRPALDVTKNPSGGGLEVLATKPNS